uniref:DUF1409 domain-containing protein n=1 Tax=Arundo donax TaxID=35708 RepID=A0A0A9DMG9_ARUDO
MGFGQLPVGLFFIDKLKARQPISSGLEYNWILRLAEDLPLGDHGDIILSYSCSKLFVQWWRDWKKHIFWASPSRYLALSDSEDEGPDRDPPTISSSGQPIQYQPSSATPILGADAPTVSALMKSRQAVAKRAASKAKDPNPKKRRTVAASIPVPSAPAFIATDLTKEPTEVLNPTIQDAVITLASSIQLPPPSASAPPTLDSSGPMSGVEEVAATEKVAMPERAPTLPAPDSDEPIIELAIELAQALPSPSAPQSLAVTINEPTGSPQEVAVSPSRLAQPVLSAGDTEILSDQTFIEKTDDATGPFPSGLGPEISHQDVSADANQGATIQEAHEPIINIHVTAPTADISVVSAQAARPGLFLPAEIRNLLADIQRRLDIPIESLVANAGSVRARFQEIEVMLPDDLLEALNPVAFIEYHRVRVSKARQRISEREAQAEQIALATSAEKRAEEEKNRFEAIQAKSAEIQAYLDQLK